MQENSSESEGRQSPVDDPGRSIIALFPTTKKAHEAGLAVLAAGSPYWVYPYEDRFALVVETAQAAHLKNEVRIYKLRNRFWPSVSPSLPEQTISSVPTFAFTGLLIVIFYLQGYYPALDDLGMNSSQDILNNHAWWRVITAVTLHADLGHLTGNLFGIALFGYFAARYLGNGLAWLGIVFVSALANVTNILIHLNDNFFSLGASTAVFGALGLVTGFPVGSFLRTGSRIAGRQWLIPLAGGSMLLAWLGSGNFPTDVAGHLWAFLHGLLYAILVAKLKVHARVTKGGQRILLGLTWAILAGCWILALS